MRLALTLSALLILAAPAAVGQGLLERSREEPARAPAAPDRSDDCASDDDGDLLGCVLGELFGPSAATVCAAALCSPFTVPHALLGDDLDRSASFPAHPYALPEGGFLDTALRREPDATTSPFTPPPSLKSWSVRAQAENGNDFSGLNRTGAALVFDTGSRFGLSSRWDHYRECLSRGRRDHTTLGDVHLTYRFAQSRGAALYAGAGARWRFDHRDTSGGVSFLYGADFFPVKPLVLSGAIELGHLDRNFVLRARASAGWQIGRCELLGGYDFLRLGSVNLQGPFLGVRLSF